MRSDEARLQDILKAIQQIQEYVAENDTNFKQSQLIQSAVLYQIIIIGEATANLSSSVYIQYPDIPWIQIIGMRNILAHEYFRVNLDRIWNVIEIHLPRLKSQIEEILN